MTMFEKRRGRPSTSEHMKIKNEIQLCYLQELKAKTAIELTGYDKKTVRRYYKMWDVEVENIDDRLFLKQAKERKQKSIMRFNYQISKLDEMSGILIDKIKQSGESITKEFIQCVRLWQENEKMISMLTLYSTNIGNSPTADVSLEQKVEELKKKIV